MSTSSTATLTLTHRSENSCANGCASPADVPDAHSSAILPTRGSEKSVGAIAKHNKRSGNVMGAHFSSAFAQRISDIAHSCNALPSMPIATCNVQLRRSRRVLRDVVVENNVDAANRSDLSRGAAPTVTTPAPATLAAPASASRKTASKVQRSNKSAKEGSKSTASLGSQTAHASLSFLYVASAPDANGAAPAGGCTCRGESQLLGTALCPILNQMPMIEPLVCNRVSAERLSEIFFRRLRRHCERRPLHPNVGAAQQICTSTTLCNLSMTFSVL